MYIQSDQSIYYWLIDFWESVEGVLYFLQIKSLKVSSNGTPRVNHKREKAFKKLKQIAQKNINSLQIDEITKRGMYCNCNLFCKAFKREHLEKPFDFLVDVMNYLKKALRSGIFSI